MSIRICKKREKTYICSRNAGDKGSVTVETAISLSVFIIAFFSLMCLVKFIILYGYVQDTVTDIAMEISAADYLMTDERGQYLSRYKEMGNIFYSNSTYEGGIGGVYFMIWNQDLQTGSELQTEFSKLLSGNEWQSDELLEGLGLSGGVQGIDFSKSRLYKDSSGDPVVNVTAEYNVQIAFFKNIRVKNSATTTTWKAEYGGSY